VLSQRWPGDAPYIWVPLVSLDRVGLESSPTVSSLYDFTLTKISPCSPGNRWMAFGLRTVKTEGVGLIDRAILVSKISNLCGPDPPTSRMDDMQLQYCTSALCTTVHHVVKIWAWDTWVRQYSSYITYWPCNTAGMCALCCFFLSRSRSSFIFLSPQQQIWMYHAAAYVPGRGCMCTHQMATLFCMKLCQSCHAKIMTSNEKYDSVNRCEFTG